MKGRLLFPSIRRRIWFKPRMSLTEKKLPLRLLLLGRSGRKGKLRMYFQDSYRAYRNLSWRFQSQVIEIRIPLLTQLQLRLSARRIQRTRKISQRFIIRWQPAKRYRKILLPAAIYIQVPSQSARRWRLKQLLFRTTWPPVWWNLWNWRRLYWRRS